MNQYPLWKYILLVAMIVFGVIYSLPNLYGEDYAVQISERESTTIDDSVIADVKAVLKQQNLPFISVVKEEGNVLVRFLGINAQ